MGDELTFIFTREPEAEQKRVGVVPDAILAVARPLHRRVSPSQACVKRRNAEVVFHSFLLEPRAEQLGAERCLDTAKPLCYLRCQFGFPLCPQT